MIKHISDIVVFLVGVSPLIFEGARFIAQKNHNTKMLNFITRMQIIVDGLSNTSLGGPDKKLLAMKKGAEYAKDIGFSITPNQVEDYLEAAVKVLKSQEAPTDGTEEENTTGDTPAQ